MLIFSSIKTVRSVQRAINTGQSKYGYCMLDALAGVALDQVSVETVSYWDHPSVCLLLTVVFRVFASVSGGTVELQEFEATPEGIIDCFTVYSKLSGQFNDTLESLWSQDKHFWE